MLPPHSRQRRRKVSSVPQGLEAIKELTAGQESVPEPAPVREPTESVPEPAPVREPTESVPEPAPVREPTESAPEPSAGQEVIPEPPKLLAMLAPPKLLALLAPPKCKLLDLPAPPKLKLLALPAPPWPSSRVLFGRTLPGPSLWSRPGPLLGLLNYLSLPGSTF